MQSVGKPEIWSLATPEPSIQSLSNLAHMIRSWISTSVHDASRGFLAPYTWTFSDSASLYFLWVFATLHSQAPPPVTDCYADPRKDVTILMKFGMLMWIVIPRMDAWQKVKFYESKMTTSWILFFGYISAPCCTINAKFGGKKTNCIWLLVSSLAAFCMFVVDLHMPARF